MGELSHLLSQIFAENGFLGLFAVSGWIVAFAVSFLAFWRVKKLSEEMREDKQYFRSKLEQNNDLSRQIVRESTEIMTKVSDRFELLQTLIIQMVNNKRGNDDKS